MDQEQIKFGIELPKELHRQVKIAVATRSLKMKEASEQAFTGWLESVGEAPDESGWVAASRSGITIWRAQPGRRAVRRMAACADAPEEAHTICRDRVAGSAIGWRGSVW